MAGGVDAVAQTSHPAPSVNPAPPCQGWLTIGGALVTGCALTVGTVSGTPMTDNTGALMPGLALLSEIDNPHFLPDFVNLGKVWGAAQIRVGMALSYPGNSIAGSADEEGSNQFCVMEVTSGAQNYEKDCGLAWAYDVDPSGTGFVPFHDAVGWDSRCEIAGTNTLGHCFGGGDYVFVDAGGDGQAIGREIDVYNQGTSQVLPHAANTKTALFLACSSYSVTGYNNCTDGIDIYSAGPGATTFQTGIWAISSGITPGGDFLRLDDSVTGNPKFEVMNAGSPQGEAALRLSGTIYSTAAANNSGDICTGLGTGGTCTFYNGEAQDNAGILVLNTGTASTSNLGDVEITMGYAAPAIWVCTANLMNGAGNWSSASSLIIKSIDSSHVDFSWYNSTVSLALSSTYSITYHCIAE